MKVDKESGKGPNEEDKGKRTFTRKLEKEKGGRWKRSKRSLRREWMND
jgi:hypothetical protein